MAKPSTAPGRTGGASGTSKRVALLVGGFAVSYGLVLTIWSDTFFWFAIPGLLGFCTVVILALHLILRRSFGGGAVPFATDGTDRRGPVTYHYRVLIGRYLLIVVPAIAMVVLPLVLGVGYLNPFIAAGLLSLSLGTRFWLGQVFWVWKCGRVLKVYEFEFRSPVRKSDLHSLGRRSLTPGAGAPRMSARDPMFAGRWPREIADGAWFAGDDAFGGVILVPDTGELMCMQPENWLVQEKERQRADAGRRDKAERAGLTRKSI